MFTCLALTRSTLTAGVCLRGWTLATATSAFKPGHLSLLHTTASRPDLMEFFDDKDNWGAEKVRVGRHWLKDELRLKSNEDLHKLWFILLKERNMLLTMEHAYLREFANMPNQERIDKVDMSMENLEEVVRERNRAYYELEVGGSGELEREIVEGPFGLDEGYQQTEHPVPYWQNLAHQRKYKYRYRTGFGPLVRLFYRRYRENVFRKLYYKKCQQLLRAAMTVRRFPKTDPEALEAAYPDVKYSEVVRYDRAKGNNRNAHIDAPKLVGRGPSDRRNRSFPKGPNW